MLVQKLAKNSSEHGLLAISLSLAAMLFYIWIRFEWQFSLAAIIALIHDVIITVGIFSFLVLRGKFINCCSDPYNSWLFDE